MIIQILAGSLYFNKIIYQIQLTHQTARYLLKTICEVMSKLSAHLVTIKSKKSWNNSISLPSFSKNFITAIHEQPQPTEDERLRILYRKRN
ncbi:unnamed protein product [Rhizophagus irregularis]|nr:unnamed protein product [Rhizophagus irregularis]